MDIDKVEVGKRIKNIRLENSKNLREFGELISKNLGENKYISDSIVSRWEKGTSVPSAKRLKEIAEIGNVSVNFLLYGAEVTYNDISKNIGTPNMQKFIVDNFEFFIKNYLLYSEYNHHSIKTAELLSLLSDVVGYDITSLTRKMYNLVSDKNLSFYHHGVYLLLNEDFSKLHIQIYLTDFIYDLLVQITLEHPEIYTENIILQIEETKENIKNISFKIESYAEFELKKHLADFINYEEYRNIFESLDQLKDKISSDKTIIKNNNK